MIIKIMYKVIHCGCSLFSDKFIRIAEFMSYSDKYIYLLKDIYIAVFNHQRLQAIGNTINLLAMGKKVYFRECATQKNIFQ